jgi:hypothetical protein
VSDRAAISESYFLSYSRADERFALRFATDLRAAGVAMWVDQLDIRPSEHWDRAIERAVRECRGLVVILSPRSVASENVADEISFAINSGKSVLPVMIERCTPPLRITRMQVIDATGNYERALRQCLVAIGGIEAESPAAPTGIADAELIAAAKARLTEILGPISAMLVDKAAAQACSVSDFYGLLTRHIDSEDDRERFIKLAGAPPATPPKPSPPSPPTAIQASVSQPDVDRLTSFLTIYLGPMARVIVRRESAGAASADELKQKLASRIPNEQERTVFLRQVDAR